MINTRVLLIILASLLASNAIAQQPPLTLQRATERFIQNSLDLQVARHQLERVKADQMSSRLRPNPSVSISAENLAVSGPTPFGRLYEVGVTYSETIELGGKRALREEVAGRAVAVAETQIEDAVRRGLAETKRLFYAALLARANVEVASENRRTFDRLVQLSTARFQEGAIPEGDLIKVRLERVKFDSAVRQAELSLRQATIRLLDKIGESTYDGQEIAGALMFQPIEFDVNALRRFATTERSDVRVAARELDGANDKVRLERGRAKTDLTPFAGYKRVGSDNTVLAGVNIPLKLRDQNQTAIARAEADVKTAQTRLQQTRNHAMAEVEAALEGLRTAQDFLQVFQTDLLNLADESRAITQAAYEEGGTDLIPVLEAQRTRAEVRQQYFKTLFDYQASVIDLELAVGKEIQP